MSDSPEVLEQCLPSDRLQQEKQGVRLAGIPSPLGAGSAPLGALTPFPGPLSPKIRSQIQLVNAKQGPETRPARLQG